MKVPEIVNKIFRRSLDAGQTVEIDGLGTFQRAVDGACRFSAQRQPQVFIAYVVEDLALARRLCDALRAGGCSPWLDKEKLLPGQNWPRSIAHAIEDSDAFVACFSSHSISKRGQFQVELRYALDCALTLPLDDVFVIPARFERCAVPRRILEHTQYVDLFPDWERGVKRMVKMIRRGLRGTVPLRSRLVVK